MEIIRADLTGSAADAQHLVSGLQGYIYTSKLNRLRTCLSTAPWDPYCLTLTTVSGVWPLPSSTARVRRSAASPQREWGRAHLVLGEKRVSHERCELSRAVQGWRSEDGPPFFPFTWVDIGRKRAHMAGYWPCLRGLIYCLTFYWNKTHNQSVFPKESKHILKYFPVVLLITRMRDQFSSWLWSPYLEENSCLQLKSYSHKADACKSGL